MLDMKKAVEDLPKSRVDGEIRVLCDDAAWEECKRSACFNFNEAITCFMTFIASRAFMVWQDNLGRIPYSIFRYYKPWSHERSSNDRRLQITRGKYEHTQIATHHQLTN